MSNAYFLLKVNMGRIANIVHNASQGNSVNKDDMLDSLIRIVEDFNDIVPEKDRVKINDYRR